ncbi:hypothetical protein GCM10028807_29550 [Spirosoma daeguense]
MKPTPRLPTHPATGVPQVSCLVAEGNYTHLYFHDGGHYLSALTLGKVCQRYPYLVRLNKGLAVDPALIVDWHIPGRNQFVVILQGGVREQVVTVSRRRISQVKQVLSRLNGDK